jgi:Tol biopolymer transport system component
MSLPPGARLGPYEITGALGAGGMGAVYRARDTRLGRTVAIKVLSDGRLADPEARARFDQEAVAISALNHPHICTLHDVGHHDGMAYLVMEHVEGETLAARLARGRVSRSEALAYAIDLASALDTAHRRGIVHRDVKPANVILAKNGAKLLDFGVARLLPSRRPDATTNVGAADTGIAGTLEYMAPEQLEGREADARSDIWSLGVVLHEMLAGQHPFPGDSSARIISAVLTEDPTAIATGRPSLDHIVQTALAKEPDARWQSAADVATCLRWIADTPAGDAPGSTAMATGAVGTRSMVVGAGLSAAVIAAALLLWRALLPPPPVAPQYAISLDILPPAGVDFSTPGEVQAAWPIVSPDGTRVIMAGGRPGEAARLWMRRLDSAEITALTGTERAALPFWAPDSRRVGFFSEGRLRVVDIDGGSPRALTDTLPDQERGGTWSTDGTILFAVGQNSALSRIAEDGSGRTDITALDTAGGVTSHRWPHFLPDGRHFLFTIRAQGDQGGIHVGSLDGAPSRRLLPDVTNAVYGPTGHILFGRAGTLLAQPFDLSRLELTGAAAPIVNRIAFSPSYRFGAFSVSRTGVLAYGPAALPSQLEWLDREGHRIARVGPPGEYLHPRPSPDNTRIVVARLDAQLATFDLWLIDAARGDSMTRLTFEAESERFPTWSPDGAQLAFSKLHPGGASGIMVRAANGIGVARELVAPATNGRYSSFVSDWSADGTTVVFTAQRPESNWDIDSVDVATGRATPFLSTPFLDVQGQLSPDGRWLAYASDESGRLEVYVRPFPSGDGKWPISTAGGQQPRWRADGRELFYLAPDGTLMAIGVNAATTFAAGLPAPLFVIAVPDNSPQFGRDYTVSPDGQRFLVNSSANGRTGATVVLNWTSTLQ